MFFLNRREFFLCLILSASIGLHCFFYYLRLSTGIFNLDEYWLWFLGLLCWINAYKSVRLNSLFFVVSLCIGYIVWLFIIKANGDSNSLKTLLTGHSLIGITIFFKSKIYISKPKTILLILLPTSIVNIGVAFYQAFYGHYDSLVIKGFFLNSGFFANYTAAFVPMLFSMLFNKNLSKGERTIVTLLLIAFIILIVLTVSRSAILGAIVGCFLFLVLFFNFSKFTIRLKTNFILIAIVLSGLFFIYLYNLKKDSADGRILIYKVSLSIIKQNPVFGIGLGRFQAEYNNYQSKYFESGNVSTKFQLLSSDTFEAYNIFLQVLCEYGIIGFFLVVVLTTLVVHQCTRKMNQNPKEVWYYYGCLGSLCAIFIESLFSNPFHISPILLSFFIVLGVCLSYTHIFFLASKRGFFLCVNIIVGLFAMYYAIQQAFAETKWRRASELAMQGEFGKALPVYKDIYSVLYTNGRFLYNYGVECSLADSFFLSERILNEAKKYSSYSNLYVFQGENYVRLKIYNKAELSYLHAIHCIPWHIYPKFELLKLYREMKLRDKEEFLKQNIINYPIKINSELANEILSKLKSNNY
jgi:O-antigen polymerase